ncbi:IS1380 family transposase [Bacteroidia bacterium]|nr:IS1380 family transposase [Bacteroidia bacterium]
MHKNTKKNDTTNEQTLFCLSSVQGKAVEASFTAPDLSTMGGLVLMNEHEKQNGFLQSLTDCITDNRSQFLVQHPYYEMIRQRVFQIAAGYEDADDCDLLRDDSLLKICSGRLPDSKPLSSQPTVSRLENKLTDRELYKIGECFIAQFIQSYEKEPEVIILDCDDSNFNAYGAQQGILFNDYYGEYCYMPLFIFEGISGKMILPLLRPGRRNKSTNIYKILRRLISRLRKVWKHTQFVVRGDSHFCCHELMDWNEEQFIESQNFMKWADNNEVWFITGLTGNKALSNRTKDWVVMAQDQFKKHGEPIRFFKTFSYKAASWKYAQRVIVKIEVTSMGTNIRYVVTNFRNNNSRFLYQELYCGRGQMELYIKELKNYLDADRTSCNAFEANQFRLFLHAAAYVILLEIKQKTFKGSELEKVSILTLREKVLLAPVHIRQMKSKIKIEFSDKHPYKQLLSNAFELFARWRAAA